MTKGQKKVKKVMREFKKGKKIMKSMREQYGKKRGEQVFYASKNKGTIKGVEKKKKRSKNAKT